MIFSRFVGCFCPESASSSSSLSLPRDPVSPPPFPTGADFLLLFLFVLLALTLFVAEELFVVSLSLFAAGPVEVGVGA